MSRAVTLVGGMLGAAAGLLVVTQPQSSGWLEVLRFGTMIAGMFAGTFGGTIVADRRLGAGEAGAVGGGLLGFLVGYGVSVLPTALFPFGFTLAATAIGLCLGGAIDRRKT